MTQNPKAPIAKKIAHQSHFHGLAIEDPYHWLKDPHYPDVQGEEILNYIGQENIYFDAYMKPINGLKTKIFNEIKARIKDDDASVPLKHKNYEYFWSYEKGAEHPSWQRRHIETGDVRVFLDEAERAKPHDYYKSRTHDISPDEQTLVWSEDINGSERFTLFVKNIKTGEHHKDTITNTAGIALWGDDNKCFLYVELNESLRPYQLKLHVLGTEQKQDPILYSEKDDAFFVGISKLRSGDYFIINCGDHVTSEVRLVPCNDPMAKPIIVAPRRSGHQYELTRMGDYFYIRSNDSHKNFRVLRAPKAKPQIENWREYLPPNDDIYIRAISGFKSFLVVEDIRQGLDQISVHSENTKPYVVPFPEPVFMASMGETYEFTATNFRINYQSMVTPRTVLNFDITSQKQTVLKEQEIPSGYDKSQYTTERIWAPARDGVMVPISIVYKNNFEKNGEGKVHLYAYGAYGIGMQPSFSSARLSLLDRGFAYAIAHVRGGDELGYGWYEDGKLNKRTNTFHDFIDVAHFLIQKNYCKKGHISASGGSAGGSLMGYIANSAPDLWRAIVAHVPFVDILNTMLDDKLPLTPIEWPEWGNPIKDKKVFEYIRSYSPYDQVSAQNYPPILVTAGLNDPRVTYWEPAKWVAKLRDMKTDQNPLLLKTNMGAGHGGKSGRYDSLHELAEEFAFLIHIFGGQK